MEIGLFGLVDLDGVAAAVAAVSGGAAADFFAGMITRCTVVVQTCKVESLNLGPSKANGSVEDTLRRLTLPTRDRKLCDILAYFFFLAVIR